MIPGNDEYMGFDLLLRPNGKVKMMCLGHVLLEEHTPHGLEIMRSLSRNRIRN